MKLTNRAEEILESLWVQLVEAHRKDCDASILHNDPALSELTRNKLVLIADERLTLTSAGHDAAKACIRRHRLAERLMTDILHVRKPRVNEPSCAFEHLLHRGLDENICTLLGHPRFCPHNKPIPEGACCIEARKHSSALIARLSELKPDDEAEVAYLQTQDPDTLQQLISIGLLPSAPVKVMQTKPSLVFELGRSQFAIDHKLASHVLMRLGK